MSLNKLWELVMDRDLDRTEQLVMYGCESWTVKKAEH